jgi:electron transport complex protein RnfG
MIKMLKLGFTLALFAAAACVMLAFVYSGTAAIIAQREVADMEAALRELFPDADSFRVVNGIQSPDLSVTVGTQYEALQNGKVAGAALQVSRGSYGGPIKILVGVNADKTITGIKILEHSDTPGLGANAASPTYFVDQAAGITFYGQFAGKNVNDPFEVKGDVQAVTASTVTSVAVAVAVKAAGRGAAAWIAGEEVEVDLASAETIPEASPDAASGALAVAAAAAAEAVPQPPVVLDTAMKELFPEADSFREVAGIQSPDPSVTIEGQHEALQNGKVTGVVLRVSRAGFAGPIKILVGVGANKTITGIKILEHTETPGLGANAAQPAFYGQFAGKAVTDPFEAGNDVQAITASTITSVAVSAAVKAAGTGGAAWIAGEKVEIAAAPPAPAPKAPAAAPSGTAASGTAPSAAPAGAAAPDANMKELFPEADSFRAITGIQSPDPSVAIEGQHEALQNGKVTGVVLRVSRAGFAGPIKILVGVGANKTITGIKILEHTETPGLGANAAQPAFYGQFAGKAVTDPFEAGNDVQAITASTITSVAVSAAVKAAGTGAAAWLEGK